MNPNKGIRQFQEMIAMQFKDALGNDISVGDYFCYAVRSGNSGEMIFGKVVELVSKKDEYSDKLKLKIKAQTLKRGWRGGFTKTSRVSTLECLDRLVKLDGAVDNLMEQLA